MKKTEKTRDTVLTALFAVIIAVCAWISVPTTVPFTMQTFGVFSALIFLGGRKGILSVILYILMGIVGLPVYSNGTAGLGVLLGPTGGYMLGWIFSGLVMWLCETLFGKRAFAKILSVAMGLVVCYITGTVWFVLSNGNVDIGTAVLTCVVPFIIPDLIKVSLALWLAQKLKRIRMFN